MWTGCKRGPVGCWGYGILRNCRIHTHLPRSSPCASVYVSVLLSSGSLRERDRWGDRGVDGRMMLGWIFKKWDVGVRTGLG
jgi:hypothetical protein